MRQRRCFTALRYAGLTSMVSARALINGWIDVYSELSITMNKLLCYLVISRSPAQLLKVEFNEGPKAGSCVLSPHFTADA